MGNFGFILHNGKTLVLGEGGGGKIMSYMVMTLCKEGTFRLGKRNGINYKYFLVITMRGFTLLKSDACDGVMRPFF